MLTSASQLNRTFEIVLLQLLCSLFFFAFDEAPDHQTQTIQCMPLKMPKIEIEVLECPNPRSCLRTIVSRKNSAYSAHLGCYERVFVLTLFFSVFASGGLAVEA
jgi:hypothetical protein